ncbi:SDR family NAD(P)-dependent oxidoreductase [Maritimibacter sp. DP1N21-5]|uniref:SDR family NAD(P)-dependent oxidoreductase n=1 Tax=Maritimibacter sp. DP1N21-5 TaxID=2836867 RepID=UPI001C43CB21|nr:SDR family oxidoreductase [Maritimibacter sp. DP1N21-5]MBV7410668.1 SDR family oxidoreductase [Maritimibacter sp. DP1N21-5]
MRDLGLKGKRVLVTGAAGGLGRAFARAFAEAGARVMAADIVTAGLEVTACEVEKAGGEPHTGKVDVSSTESCRALALQVDAELGGLDVLVNNAALYGTLDRKPFEEIDEGVWDQVMQVNIKGVWQMCRAFATMLRAADHGSIVNVASATVFSGSPEWMHYVTSKGAVIAMSRVMAKELGPDNVRVNAIAPGFTLTEASLNQIDNAIEYGVGRAAMRRNAEAQDITGAALYLASDLSRFMTGQTLIVDGGKQFI